MTRVAQEISLGTAQFGSPYGVSNKAGQLSEGEVDSILKFAEKTGIKTLDTAVAYGCSETVLGRLGVKNWSIVTKVPPLPKICPDVTAWIIAQVRGSLARLNVDRLAGVLLHDSNDLVGPRHEEVTRALRHLKDEGIVHKTGVSIYSPSVLGCLISTGVVDLVQAPINVLDQRLPRSGWLQRLNDLGIEVHGRSVFLQGLLLLPANERPKSFDRWAAVFRKWDEVVSSMGNDPLSLCLGFLKSYPTLGHIIVGVDRVGHLDKIIESYTRAPPVLMDAMNCEDRELIEPRLWVRS